MQETGDDDRETGYGKRGDGVRGLSYCSTVLLCYCATVLFHPHSRSNVINVPIVVAQAANIHLRSLFSAPWISV